MKYMDKFANPTLLIVPNNLKRKVIKDYSSKAFLNNIKVMSLSEFIKNMTFTYENDAIFYLMEHYGFKPSVAKIYLDNLIYITSNNNSNLDSFLLKLKAELDNNNLLKYNNNFIKQINKYEIYIYGFSYVPKFLKFLLSKLTGYKTLEPNELPFSRPKVLEFINQDKEINYVFKKIANLISQNVNINNIKLVVCDNTYLNEVKRLAFFYNIPINDNKKTSLLNLEEVKEYLNICDEINDIKKAYEKHTYKYREGIINDKIVSVINSFIWFQGDFSQIKGLFISELNNTYLDEISLSKALEIVKIDDINDANNYYFVIGANQGVFPNLIKDEDYIPDNKKHLYNLDDTLTINNERKKEVANIITSIPNIEISYKLIGSNGPAYPSSIIEDLNLEIIKEPNIDIQTSFSKDLDLLTTASLLDDLNKYDTIDNNLSIYYSNYHNIPYLKYDNNFKSLDIDRLNKLWTKGLTLAYSSINKYFQCGFRYYIDHVLYLTPYVDTFATKIGNLFHQVLQKMYEPNFDFDKEVAKYLETTTFNIKENFYLKKMIQELKFVVNNLKVQQTLTSFNNMKFEERIAINFDKRMPVTFKGFIDKIIYYEKDNNLYAALIDYKTGNDSINMNNIKYGIGMQLPTYLYLASSSPTFKNAVWAGFYLQNILNNELTIDSGKDIKELKVKSLRLNGYTTNNQDILALLDKTYQNSDLIKNLKLNKDGSFAFYSKVLSINAMNELITLAKTKIDEGINMILDGMFNINPKIIDGKNEGCKYCTYSDLCFKKGENYIYLGEAKDMEEGEVVESEVDD